MSAAAGDTLTIAINGDPQSLDPAKNGSGPQQLVQWLSYEPLIRTNADGSFSPALAESWKYTGADNTAFEMTLREGATFADGTPVTADAVVRTLKYFIATPSPSHSTIETVSDVTAPDERTVRITFSQPTPNAPRVFSQLTNYGDIISPAGLKKKSALGTATFGAGAYTLDKGQSVSGDRYTFVKNDKYWNPKAQHYKKIVVRIIGDSKTALSALRTGQIDVSTVTEQSQVDQAESAGLDVVAGGKVSIMVWLMDGKGKVAPAMADPRVRKALNLAIDRKAVATTLGKAYQPLSQFASPGAEGYSDAVQAYEYDPAQAKKLLDEAGVGKGFTLALGTNTDNRDAEVSQILVEQWAKIGVKVSLRTFDNQPSEMFGSLAAGKFSAITFAVSMPLSEMSAQLTRKAVFNPFGVTEPAVNDAFAQYAKAGSGKTADAAQNVGQVVHEAALFVPVASVERYLFAKNVDDLGRFGSYGEYDVLNWKPGS
ncbi:ABC transporter substrate-binding protein [Streptomyces sp. VNUA24]|uniref:ABC transporter substrate-binding protein n=1 Tax=Streptomyces sp. VNUA24 TaxID=3031131 RepID=UPI0023B7BE4F|nr:ABC transporter substrate-binding protein [Streptomyces sp. VNUA24]WEH12874.1 ABC transporter substrate-binding protein [Streptomyces sp. VNUA24]